MPLDPHSKSNNTYIYIIHSIIIVEHSDWKSSIDRSAAFCTCSGYNTISCSNERPIHSRTWMLLEFKCGPMWFTISLDPPPSTWRRKYRLSDKWPWPAWKTTLLTCCSRAVYSSGYPLLGSKSFFLVLFTSVQVLIYTWVQPLNGLHALFWDLSRCKSQQCISEL